MKLLTFAGRNNKPIVKLPNGVVGLVANFDHADTEFDTEYEFMLTGYGKKLTEDGYPTVVFVQRVRENDTLVSGYNLVQSAGMCSTSTSVYLTGHNRPFSVYPGKKYPGFIADEVGTKFHNLSYFPQIIHPIWITKSRNGKFYAVGVNSYDHLAPCLANTPEFSIIQKERDDHYQRFLDRLEDRRTQNNLNIQENNNGL